MHISSSQRYKIYSNFAQADGYNIEFIGQLFYPLEIYKYWAVLLLSYIHTGNFAPIISLNDCLYWNLASNADKR